MFSMKKPKKQDIARACIIAYVILFLLSGLLLCGPGCLVGWFVVISFALFLPIIIGSTKQRIIVCICLAVSLIFILLDNEEGKAFQKRVAQIHRKARENKAIKAQAR